MEITDHMKSAFCTLFLYGVMTLIGHHPGYAEEKLLVESFPEKKIFPSFTADALAHQLSISCVAGNSHWIGVVGGVLPLVSASSPEFQLQFSAAASIFSRLFIQNGHFAVYTVDYKVELPIDLRLPCAAFRFGYGHISSHLADGGIEQMGKSSVTAFNDYLMAAMSIDAAPILGYAYAGLHYSLHVEPILNKRVLLQLGSEFGRLDLSSDAQIYGAVDVKLKQNVGWGSTQSYQCGVRLFRKGEKGYRIAYTHRRGFDERGQLFQQSETLNLISFYIDF